MTSFLNFSLIPILAFCPLVLIILSDRLVFTDNESNILNWRKLLGLYIFSTLTVYALVMIAVHQFAFLQLHFDGLMNDSEEAMRAVTDLFVTYGDRHRTFGHGMLHGAEAGVFLGLFFVGSISMMEGWTLKKFFRYFLTFLIIFTISGGLVCQLL